MTDAAVLVEYSTTIARSIGVTEEPYEPEHCKTLADLCAAIAARHGDRVRGVLLAADGGLASSVIAAVNDSQSAPNRDTPVAAGDCVLFLSAIGGG